MTKPRNILFCVSGFQPQIITQALYHFNIDRKIHIDEVVLISTATTIDTYYKGYDVRQTPVFIGSNGKLSEFFLEYDLPQPILKIFKIADSEGNLLTKIRVKKDFDAAALTILNKLRDLGLRENDQVHCIYAGGQRVLASYLMSSLVLVGDHRHRLYYINISESDIQESPNFFYPPKVPKTIRKLDGKDVYTADIKINANEINFPRLGVKYSGLVENDSNYQDVIDHIQLYISSEAKPIEPSEFDGEEAPLIVGKNKKLLEALEKVKEYALAGLSPVLLFGETGTGKELVAKYYHYWYEQKAGKKTKYITINCGAIPSELIESELFGFKKGTHSTATFDKEGKLAAADGGVVFLDEITSASLDVQAKLLRFLDDGEIQVVGATTSNDRVEVKILFGANQELETLVESGSVRDDFYYRIAGGHISLPTLAERKDDIPDIIEVLMDAACKKFGKNKLGLSDDLMNKLSNHSWGGNVRQLKRYLENQVVLTKESGIITKLSSEPPEGLAKRQRLPANSILRSIIGDNHKALSHKEKIDRIEEWLLQLEFEENARSVSKTSEATGLKPSTLKDKLERYSIKKPESRPG